MRVGARSGANEGGEIWGSFPRATSPGALLGVGRTSTTRRPGSPGPLLASRSPCFVIVGAGRDRAPGTWLAGFLHRKPAAGTMSATSL